MALGEITGYLIIALVAQRIGYGDMYGFTGLVALVALGVLLGFAGTIAQGSKIWSDLRCR